MKQSLTSSNIHQIMQAKNIMVEKPEQNNPAAPQSDANGDTWRDANSKLKSISFTNVSGFNVQNLIVGTRFSSLTHWNESLVSLKPLSSRTVSLCHGGDSGLGTGRSGLSRHWSWPHQETVKQAVRRAERLLRCCSVPAGWDG